MNLFLRVAPLVIVLMFSLLLTLGLVNHLESTAPSKLVGQKLENFSIPMLGKKDETLSPEGWRGRVVVVNVFASWCVPCAAEAPALKALAESKKVEMLGIAWKDKPEKLQEWLHTYGNPFRAVGIDADGDTTLPLALSGIPETFVIDADGTIVYNYKSALTDDIVNTDILPLIAKLEAQHAAP